MRRPPDGPEHADGGEAVLLRLVALIAEARFGAGLPRQLRRVQGARAGQRLRDAVKAALVQFLQALEGLLRLLRQQADLLPGAQIAVKFHGRSSLFLLLPAAGPAASHTASAKAVQAARQAERVPVSRAPAKFVSVGGA